MLLAAEFLLNGTKQLRIGFREVLLEKARSGGVGNSRCGRHGSFPLIFWTFGVVDEGWKDETPAHVKLRQ